jgi:phosphonate transport system substrate-binding protein
MLFRAFLFAALLMPAWAAAQSATYRFSPVNQWDIARTAAYWNPIIRYVSDKSGVRLELKIGRTSADTTAYVLAQEVEFVFSSHLFSPERDQLGWKVFGRRWTPPLQGQIAVPVDSPITRLE